MQQYYADGGTGLDFDTAQACVGSYQLPLKSDSALGQYLVNAGFSSQTTADKILKYGDTNCISYDGSGAWTSAPELGVIDFFIGKKCVAPKGAGGYSLTEAGSPLSTAVTVRLEAGSTASGAAGAVMYCADASR